MILICTENSLHIIKLDKMNKAILIDERITKKLSFKKTYILKNAKSIDSKNEKQNKKTKHKGKKKIHTWRLLEFDEIDYIKSKQNNV